jgi:hypothetical protein
MFICKSEKVADGADMEVQEMGGDHDCSTTDTPVQIEDKEVQPELREENQEQ